MITTLLLIIIIIITINALLDGVEEERPAPVVLLVDVALGCYQ